MSRLSELHRFTASLNAPQQGFPMAELFLSLSPPSLSLSVCLSLSHLSSPSLHLKCSAFTCKLAYSCLGARIDTHTSSSVPWVEQISPTHTYTLHTTPKQPPPPSTPPPKLLEPYQNKSLQLKVHLSEFPTGRLGNSA